MKEITAILKASGPYEQLYPKGRHPGAPDALPVTEEEIKNYAFFNCIFSSLASMSFRGLDAVKEFTVTDLTPTTPFLHRAALPYVFRISGFKTDMVFVINLFIEENTRDCKNVSTSGHHVMQLHVFLNDNRSYKAQFVYRTDYEERWMSNPSVISAALFLAGCRHDI